MNCLRKNYHQNIFHRARLLFRCTRWILGAFLLCSIGVGGGCSTPRYAYHSIYQLKNCQHPMSQEGVLKTFIRSGFLRFSETKGPYNILHRPEILKKGSLSQEPFEDVSGDIALAICPGVTDSYILAEEWRSCQKKKDCTMSHQKAIKHLVKGWNCEVFERAGRSESWKIEDRQDWTQQTCTAIVESLKL